MNSLVVDASTVVAALVDEGSQGKWARSHFKVWALAAPQIMPFEVANALRSSLLRGDITEGTAALAQSRIDGMSVDLYPYAAVGNRAWHLRGSLTSYDAAYVALAERLSCGLATLDRRMARSGEGICEFVLPPS